MNDEMRQYFNPDGSPDFMTDEEQMTIWHHRGYTIRSKNDGTQYYEVRYHGEKKFSGKTFLEAVQFINKVESDAPAVPVSKRII